MEKKIWSTPTANVEQYMANGAFADNYVQVCFGVACDWGEGAGNSGRPNPDPYNDQRYENYFVHTQKTDGSGCGHFTNQYIQADYISETETRYTMTEVNTDQGSDLACKYYTDSTYSTEIDYWTNLHTEEKRNQTIFWTTWAKDIWGGFQQMFHQGQIEWEDASRPNHS